MPVSSSLTNYLLNQSDPGVNYNPDSGYGTDYNGLDSGSGQSDSQLLAALGGRGIPPSSNDPGITPPDANYPQPNDSGVVGPINPNPTSSGAQPQGLLGQIDKTTGTASSILQNLAPFFNLFKKNQSKLQATALQTAVEKSAYDIEQAVKNGQMDVGAAIGQLQQTQSQLKTVGGSSPDMMSASIHANIIVGQVLANLQTRQYGQLSQPFTPGDPNALAGGPEQQKQRVGTGIRNYFAGTDLGKQFNQASPVLNKITGTGIKSPQDRLNDTTSIIHDQFPTSDIPDIKRPQRPEALY